jgi:hypothetical protein
MDAKRLDWGKEMRLREAEINTQKPVIPQNRHADYSSLECRMKSFVRKKANDRRFIREDGQSGKQKRFPVIYSCFSVQRRPERRKFQEKFPNFKKIFPNFEKHKSHEK